MFLRSFVSFRLGFHFVRIAAGRNQSASIELRASVASQKFTTHARIIPAYRRANLACRRAGRSARIPSLPLPLTIHVRAVMALTPREAPSKARTLRDISESTTSSRWLAPLSGRTCPPGSHKGLRRGSVSRKGDDFQRNSRLTRRRPVAYQSASVCRAAGDPRMLADGGNKHPPPSVISRGRASSRENGAGSIGFIAILPDVGL